MHAVFFGIKAAHLRVLAITRGLLKGRGLTPARFDMMRIVEMHEEDGVAQGKIQVLLGVSAATVSRMLTSLEKLGFVMRERMIHDARQLRVFLTELGSQRVFDAREALVECGADEYLALRSIDSDRAEARPRLEILRGLLSRVRRNFFDPAPLEHPWTLDDIVSHAAFVDGRPCYSGRLDYSQYG